LLSIEIIKNLIFFYLKLNFLNKTNLPKGPSGYLKRKEISINQCKQLYEDKFNKVYTSAWVNIVRSKEPVQPKFMNSKYHIHTDLQLKIDSFFPHYTYVYYIQMPDVMFDEDGVLYIQGMDEVEYWIRPEEDDLIILPGHLPHAISPAFYSTIDRIVMAGNVGFEYVKQNKTLI
jgi:hypothetical protein